MTLWGVPIKPLDQKMFWQNAALAFGVWIAVRSSPWVANQLAQSAQAWLRRNNRCLVGPAPTPAGSARLDVRRQGIGNVWDAAGAVGGGNAAGIDPNLGKS